ncbi:hypothetical protein NDU88_008176 [Pleurodeles waltl]|uniref:Uncharacterized protein n=1 Tax=Pleurodeles waltl TaxID=8319 RepID=A0AAV7PNR7_PLEWA|nr:hypothetical protein NDU88_008176 [Pleurodeles waltl]
MHSGVVIHNVASDPAKRAKRKVELLVKRDLLSRLQKERSGRLWLSVAGGVLGHLHCGLDCRFAQRSVSPFEVRVCVRRLTLCASLMRLSCGACRWAFLSAGARSSDCRAWLPPFSRPRWSWVTARRADTAVRFSDGLAGRRGPARRLQQAVSVGADSVSFFVFVLCRGARGS